MAGAGLSGLRMSMPRGAVSTSMGAVAEQVSLLQGSYSFDEDLSAPMPEMPEVGTVAMGGKADADAAVLAAVDAGVVGQERVEPVVAGDVQEAVGAALADAGQVGADDGQKVQYVGHRGAVEVAVGLHPPVGGDHGIVDDTGQFALGDQSGMGRGVTRGAGDLR